MRQLEGQWIRYRFNITAQLRGRELSWSAIQTDCWGSLAFANVFKEFDRGESGQSSWLRRMEACPFYLWGMRNICCCISSAGEELLPLRWNKWHLHTVWVSVICSMLILRRFILSSWKTMKTQNVKVCKTKEKWFIVNPAHFCCTTICKNQLPLHLPKSCAVNESKFWVAIKSLIDHIDLDMVPLTFNGQHLQ